MKTKKIHYLSGLIITFFVALHLFNHTCSIWGAKYHIQIMQFLRLGYRNIFVEIILVCAVLVQIISGVKLLQTKPKPKAFFLKLQIFTGLYLSFFFVIHLTAVFVGRLVLQLDTNFYFGVAGINSFPYLIFFIPYYALAIISFFGHIAAVHYHKGKSQLLGITVAQQARAILFIGIFYTIVLFYGLTNHFKGVTIPVQYNVLTGK